MDLSRRGFFKGIAALVAGVAAAQLPSCSTGGMTPAVAAPIAVAQEPIVEVVKDRRVERWLHLDRINKYKGEILAQAVPAEILTATKIKRRNAKADRYVAKRFFPYSTVPLIEGVTPLPENLLERGQPVG